MHTVELYELAKRFAVRLGFDVREENLGGTGGGACVVAGRKCVFIDVAMSAAEQLDQILLAIEPEAQLQAGGLPASLASVRPFRRLAA